MLQYEFRYKTTSFAEEGLLIEEKGKERKTQGLSLSVATLGIQTTNRVPKSLWTFTFQTHQGYIPLDNCHLNSAK